MQLTHELVRVFSLGRFKFQIEIRRSIGCDVYDSEAILDIATWDTYHMLIRHSAISVRDPKVQNRVRGLFLCR